MGRAGVLWYVTFIDVFKLWHLKSMMANSPVYMWKEVKEREEDYYYIIVIPENSEDDDDALKRTWRVNTNIILNERNSIDMRNYVVDWWLYYCWCVLGRPAIIPIIIGNMMTWTMATWVWERKYSDVRNTCDCIINS